MTFYVYALLCPMSGDARYIGMSATPDKRYKRHISNCDGGPAKQKWIKHLLDNNMKPKLLVMARASSEVKARELESLLISEFTRDGSHLLNADLQLETIKKRRKAAQSQITHSNERLYNKIQPMRQKTILDLIDGPLLELITKSRANI